MYIKNNDSYEYNSEGVFSKNSRVFSWSDVISIQGCKFEKSDNNEDNIYFLKIKTSDILIELNDFNENGISFYGFINNANKYLHNFNFKQWKDIIDMHFNKNPLKNSVLSSLMIKNYIDIYP